MSSTQELKKIAELIAQRITEMKLSDYLTKEHPDATDQDYLMWALEECEENDSLLVKIIPQCAFCGEQLQGLISIHAHTEEGKDVTK